MQVVQCLETDGGVERSPLSQTVSQLLDDEAGEPNLLALVAHPKMLKVLPVLRESKLLAYSQVRKVRAEFSKGSEAARADIHKRIARIPTAHLDRHAKEEVAFIQGFAGLTDMGECLSYIIDAGKAEAPSNLGVCHRHQPTTQELALPLFWVGWGSF